MKHKNSRKKWKGRSGAAVLLLIIGICGGIGLSGRWSLPVLNAIYDKTVEQVTVLWQKAYGKPDAADDMFSSADIPEYAGEPYTVVNDGIPFFTEEEISSISGISFCSMDRLGRCTQAVACLSKEDMPENGEERGRIGNIKPTGWHTVKYDCIPDRYCFNRCHLIAWCLCGANAVPENLVTGSRYMNLAMTEHEIMAAEYLEDTGNHVLYRVTPVFAGDDLLCRGILMEGYSVEDAGEGICFNVFYHNVQPGIGFDYQTGETWPCGN